MNWKSVVATVFMVPVLALFVGVSILAWQIGAQWDARHTTQLVNGVSTICGLTLAVLLLAAVAFTVLLTVWARHRKQREAAAWGALPAKPAPRWPGWAASPPQLADKEHLGSWEALPDGYDVWDENADDEEISGFRW
jgi:hypothetical protein